MSQEIIDISAYKETPGYRRSREEKAAEYRQDREEKAAEYRQNREQKAAEYRQEGKQRTEAGERIYQGIKRIGDILLSTTAMVLASPVFLVLAAAVYIDDPGPVFYKHERMGKDGKKIEIFKFRSMFLNSREIFDGFSEEQKAEFYREFKLEQDPRITKIGGFLRRSSLDELPQLYNVLRGEISLVGPRPIVEEELEKYGQDAKRLLSVKPGLTGYWQANGRNTISYENGRQEMELYYVEHKGFFLDLKIMFRTVGAVLSRKGAQ